MLIKKIKISNFKSFKDREIELGNFNVLIGANASGKSNFIQIFKFLRDIVKDGLENAISLQGSPEFLMNINIGSSKYFSISLTLENGLEEIVREADKDFIAIKTYQIIYEFTLNLKKEKLTPEIVKDKLTIQCDFVKSLEQIKNFNEKEKTGKGAIIISRANGKTDIEIKPKEVLKEEDIIPSFWRKGKLSPNQLLLETPFFLFLPQLKYFFSNISIYDFDPKLPKKASPITGKAELEEDGSNLSIVLKNIIENKNERRKLFNLIRELLPFVKNLDVEKFADKSLLFKLQEEYFEKQYLPASLISDGTINITALIIALYFEKKPITIIEEPERNIHPYLISKVVEMMKEASQKKQIIVSTHNPEVVKYADLENILLISRDKDGFSIISRPKDKDEIKTFLKNEIGIEELYVQNLLGI
jgi:predicted ATPase